MATFLSTYPRASLLSIPVEDVLVPLILSCLSPFEVWNLRLVCRQFYRAVYCYYNTTCLEVKLSSSLTDIGSTFWTDFKCILPITNQILTNCWRLQKFVFNGSMFVRPYYSHSGPLVEKCLLTSLANKSTLRELSLTNVFISQQTIKALRLACANLRKLSLMSIFPNKRIDEYHKVLLDLGALIKDCVTLEEFYCDSCSYQLQLALMKQSKLKVLELITNNPTLSPFKFESLFQALPSLETLTLGKIHYLTNEALLYAIEYCPLLNKVEIFECPLVTWQVLGRFESKGIIVKSDILQANVQPTALITRNQI